MFNELAKKRRSVKVYADRPVEAVKIEQTKTAPLYFDPLKAIPYQKHGDECDRRWWWERWLVCMMRQTATCLLVFWLTFVGSLACYAQTNIPPKIAQNSALNKKACDFITKSDAESILGQPVETGVNNTFVCSFIETGRANKVPPIKQVHFNVRFEASPDDYAVARKNISDHQGPTEVVKEVPNFADAAIWIWIPPAWGRLTAFKGGTIEVTVTISGIPEDAALQHAKALAARPLGGTSGTGYVYQRTLKSNAAVASAAPPAAPSAGTQPAPATAAAPAVVPRVLQAREIWRFDQLAGDDQIKYVNLLIDSVVAATQPDQLARVKRFFLPKQPGETVSGMGQFELNLSLARVADLEAVEKNPKVRRLEVEDVMYVTLERNGIVLPKGFRPGAINFQPKYPPSKIVMTKEESNKALAQTRAWVARTVPVERELPTGPMFSNNAAGLAFFRALADLQAKARANGADGSYPSTDVDTHENDPWEPWWVKSGYNSYHEAAHAACIGAHPGNRGACN